MNLLYSTLLIGVANAALPPGFEDENCPPGNCQLYIHKKGMGGPQSAFNKCYNPTTGIISEGIWTGSKTDTVPPDDYIQPEKCFETERESSSSVSSTPSPSMISTTGSTSMATLKKIHAMCDSDDQCQPVVRGSAPHPFTGVGMCGCFAESDIDPFDQCEGDRESCATARCIGEDVDNCYDMEAYCDLAPDDNGMGECRLRESKDTDDADDTDNGKRISSSDDDGDEDIIPAQCDSDDQCSATIRSQQPSGQFTGVPACECFASSYVSPFDQCEGSERCRQVRCVPGGCDGLEAYCDIAPNDNGMGQCQLRSATTEESETYADE